MTTVKAYAASGPKGRLEPFEYTLGPIGPHEVDIAVEHCGICHSDLSMLDNDWRLTQYPFVGGHEVIGKVASVGALVTHLKVGDLVGLGWNSGYCMICPSCLGGHHNLCNTVGSTVVGRHGGFADLVRAQAPSVIKLPDGLDPLKAGPLFCGGVTVFNPLVQFNVSPTSRVGVIGIGGLGHMAIQFMRAWGCHVTALTSSASKSQEALKLGAHEVADSHHPKGHFDFLLSTVNVPLDWNAYLETLNPLGRLHVVGAILEPLNISVMSLLPAQRSVSSSPVGSPGTIAKMLEFAARHNIAPVTEHFPMNRINEAFDHLRAGKARYRIVLTRG